MRILFVLCFVASSLVLRAQKDWRIEAEDASSRVTQLGDGTIDIIAPKGLTLWHKARMQGNVVIEYDARIVCRDVPLLASQPDVKERLSDLNCFWLASDPQQKDGSVLAGMKRRKGVFVNQYALQLYYMGYGGNYNTTTRFRRYDGDVRGVTDAACRPTIIREYTDTANLLRPNHWYHIRLEQIDGRVRYIIDGKTLVDYIDIRPLTKGYFGFRTTLAHAQLRNFRYNCTNPDAAPIIIRNIGSLGQQNCKQCNGSVDTPTTFGVPFGQGEKMDEGFSLATPDGKALPFDTWRLASWPDGSVKWQAFATVVPAGCDSLLLNTELAGAVGNNSAFSIHNPAFSIHNPAFYLTLNNQIQPILSHEIEREGKVLTVHKYTTRNFIVRTYHYAGCDEVRMVHTLLVDSALNHDGLREAGVHFRVPMHGEAYERYVAFDGGKPMSVQPLIARRPINVAAIQRHSGEGNAIDPVTRSMVENIAKWDGFRLSQLSSEGYTIRKRATSGSPWIGTEDGRRSEGVVTVGDSTATHSFRLKDFWQSYPSTLQVDNARSDTAIVTISLYSAEAEPYSFEHYDTIPHTLEAAYEDIQPGMSTAWGIARTSEIYINAECGRQNAECGMQKAESGSLHKPNGDNSAFCIHNSAFCIHNSAFKKFLPTPEYLHRKRAFGFWSLPKHNGDSLRIEQTLNDIMHFYRNETERRHWYGYFNYGDVMHTYDASRDEWRYDVGGYAWDNTELGTPAMLWYQFLRTGSPEVYTMAEAMTRHCAEVDCYHFGPHAGLGSRHNVTHWGCGAKEARISEAFWNRFLYYLTADDRMGDLLAEVKDADTLLYTLDPMRLAQPRSDRYPCTAPARLRIGPDWLAYASNWFTEWERTGNTHYRDKILTGMRSIAALPHGIFSGPKALGYDPATGIVSWEGDAAVQNTNHLATIMGGFEMMNEMLLSIYNKEWDATWLDHAATYKEKAAEISRNKFRIPRLKAFAYWHTGKPAYRNAAIEDLLRGNPFNSKAFFFTNDAATWILDAIFLQEVLR